MVFPSAVYNEIRILHKEYYSRLPITRTFEGNQKRFELSEFLEFELSGDRIPADTTYHMSSHRKN